MQYGEQHTRHRRRWSIKSRLNCQPCHGPRRSPVGLNLDPPGGEQVSHRRLKIGLPQAELYGLGFLGERPRRIIVGGARVADVPPLPVEPLQQLHEDLLHLVLAGQLFGVGGPQLRQEQAVLVPERDAGPERAVLVLLEFEQAQAVVGLVARPISSASGALTPLRYCRNRNAPCQAVEPDSPEPDAMPARLGWLSTVTEPEATLARACMCMAKA